MDAYLSSEFNDQKILSEWRSPDVGFYFCRVDGQLAGYLKLKFPKADEIRAEEWGIEVERIYVDATFQGRGIGSRLMEHAIVIAKAKYADRLWLGVWEHNTKAIQLYRRFGFETYGSHAFHLGTDVQTDLLMQRIL